MLLLKLFWVFFEVGAVSFGGGYAMISLIRELVLANDWLTEAELLNIIAVAESSPGPIAVNMATFVGATQAGIPGALLATLGVILPSFLIILLIAAVLKNFLKYKPVKAFMSGVRPCVVGLILATAATLFLTTLLGFTGTGFAVDLRGLGILAILALTAFGFYKWKHKKPSPILMILLSAALGMLFYSF